MLNWKLVLFAVMRATLLVRLSTNRLARPVAVGHADAGVGEMIGRQRVVMVEGDVVRSAHADVGHPRREVVV